MSSWQMTHNHIFCHTSRLARRTAIMGNGTACMFLAHSSQLRGRRRRWDHNFISGPLRFFVAPQFYQWTITVSVHGYLFQEVRDWISNWKEVVFVRKRLFFSILSPVNDHSSKKEKDSTFRFWDLSYSLSSLSFVIFSPCILSSKTPHLLWECNNCHRNMRSGRRQIL